MRPRPPLHLLLVGQTERREFRDIAALLAGETVLTCCPNLNRALAMAHVETAPWDLIVIAQSHPGEYSSNQIDALRTRFPTSPLVALLGSWCEGETRTGKPWPAAARVFWHDFPDWWRTGRQTTAERRCPAWGLPVTFAEEERLLALDQHQTTGWGLVVIASHRTATVDALTTACSDRNLATLWIRPGDRTTARGAAAVVWDGSQMSAEESHELEALSQRFPGAPLLALLDFPRIETQERAIAAGATAILAKPLLLNALHRQLDALISHAAPVAA
jgi:hypothetical protein